MFVIQCSLIPEMSMFSLAVSQAGVVNSLIWSQAFISSVLFFVVFFCFFLFFLVVLNPGDKSELIN